MHRRSFPGLLAVLLYVACRPAMAQFAETPSLQSPRQALIEMFSGSQEKFRQHLTVDLQEKLNDLPEHTVPPVSNPLLALVSATNGSEKFDSFDSGPILFSWNNAHQHQRYELHVDADESRGDEDQMELSLHSFRSGVEEEMPIYLRLQLGLVLQQSVWRLNTVTANVQLPVGDPRIFDKDKFWWMSRMLAGATPSEHETPATPDRPGISPMRAVRRIALAENLYAQHHPEAGYTCAIANLVNIGKGLDEFGPYTLLDPEFASGVYNGYNFVITGCAGKPAKSFHVIAEPVSGKGKAYCSDDRHNLRSSDDGRAETCLAAGRMARQ
jgi:hypothetical protein